MRHRRLSCEDCILDNKYFILLRTSKQIEDYFYNIVEFFLIDKLINNKNLLTIAYQNNYYSDYDLMPFCKTIKEFYLDENNYNLFKVIFYEDILEELNFLKNNYCAYDFRENINYNYDDFIKVLDYIQERSIYLGLKNYIASNGGL